MRARLGWLWMTLAACSGVGERDEIDHAPPAATPASAPEAAAPTVAQAPAERPKAPPELRPAAAEGDVAAIIAAELVSARSEGRALVVVVGAGWCEPCVAFHDALVRGELDDELAGVRFLEFDLDRDRVRLEEAGYASRLIPLFVVPGDDGRATARRIEGGIKGAGAVDHVLRRLRPLIAR